MCGGNGHVPEFCAHVISIFACQTPDDEIFNGEGEGTIVYDTLDRKVIWCPCTDQGGNDSWGRSALNWQLGGPAITCDNSTSCHMRSPDMITTVKNVHANSLRY